MKINTPYLSLIIPIYNEVKSVNKVLTQCYEYCNKNFNFEFIIVESGSTDGTRKIVQDFVKMKKNIELILENKPHGKGYALRLGFKHAKGQIILIQDGDLEYDVKDYKKLIEPIKKRQSSFVLGSRHLNEDKTLSWAIRKFKGSEKLYAYFMNFGGILFHKFFNILYGTNLTDPTTMYKVFRRELLNKVHLEGNYFELDWEIVAKFVRLGQIPIEVPIAYHARSPKEGKKVRFSRDVLRWLYTIIKFRLIPVSKF